MYTYQNGQRVNLTPRQKEIKENFHPAPVIEHYDDNMKGGMPMWVWWLIGGIVLVVGVVVVMNLSKKGGMGMGRVMSPIDDSPSMGGDSLGGSPGGDMKFGFRFY